MNDSFLKRQDYYFVLANLLAENLDLANLAGKQRAAVDKNNSDGPYAFNKEYIISFYGGMQNYNVGCLTMQLLIDHDDETGKIYSLPRLSQLGEEIALAFEEVIKDTAYYRQYRLYNTLVPREVLIEYGSVVQLNLNNFGKCKALLRRHLFERNRRLYLCSEYAKQVYDVSRKHNVSAQEARYLLYDYYSPRGEAHACPADLLDIARGWEIVIGRHYFSAGLEMIWKFMLQMLAGPVTEEEWFGTVLGSLPSSTLEISVESLLEKCTFSHAIREEMVSSARSSQIKQDTSVNGLMLALSVYNRFRDRNDLGEAATFLDYGRGRVPGIGAISINEWTALVERYKRQPVRSFLQYVMKECIVEQHKRTCFEKIIRSSQSVDGFYFEQIDGLYVKNEHEFQVDFQGNRFIQLMQVMQDLDMFEG